MRGRISKDKCIRRTVCMVPVLSTALLLLYGLVGTTMRVQSPSPMRRTTASPAARTSRPKVIVRSECQANKTHLFSAFRRCGPPSYVMLNVWEHVSTSCGSHGPKYFCCMQYADGTLRMSSVARHYPFANKGVLRAVKLVCREPKTADYRVAVAKLEKRTKDRGNLTIAEVVSLCQHNASKYLAVQTPIVPDTYNNIAEAETSKIDENCLYMQNRNVSFHEREKFSLAICAKLAFGGLNPELVIEWMEYNIKMGVSKILVYTYDLNARALHVLKHYKSLGVLDIQSFYLPLKDVEGYKRNLSEKTTQIWNDEQVALFDCYEKLRLFKYVAVVDMDEFIVPKLDRNFQELLNRLSAHEPIASGFHFKIEYHITDWVGNQSLNETSLTVDKFRLHTAPLNSNGKLVSIPGRTFAAIVWTHEIPYLLPPYKKTYVNQSVAVISHYRRCRVQWKVTQCFRQSKFTTDYIRRHFDTKLRTTILQKKKVLLSDSQDTDR